MGDLISRAALYKAWDALDKTQDPNLLIDAMIRETQDAPAVDAELVRYEHWDENGRCTGCGNHAPFWCMASTYYLSHYCPNCGARMI